MNKMLKKSFLFSVLINLIFLTQNAPAATDVAICTWKDCHKGALSFTIDDGKRTCAVALEKNKFKGTFYVYTSLKTISLRYFRYMALNWLRIQGHEIGGHMVTHSCEETPAENARFEFETNWKELAHWMMVPKKEIITMAWPCGKVVHKDIAREYFLSSRSYGEDSLEDQTPEDFMNLKSIDNGEFRENPVDMKQMLDAAESQAKWAIFVFHFKCQDQGSIAYAKEKDLWVEPVASVVKYIIQRESTNIINLKKTPQGVEFDLIRARIPPTPKRDFEESFGTKDQITLKIALDNQTVGRVTISGQPIAFETKMIEGAPHVLFNTAVPYAHSLPIKILFREK